MAKIVKYCTLFAHSQLDSFFVKGFDQEEKVVEKKGGESMKLIDELFMNVSGVKDMNFQKIKKI